ncbi:MAG: DUF4810 domain-containing protein [Bacteroidales bacterium]|nr:DUF4810 domain-containing protein [Bacteroidales bacterium]
MIRNSKLMIATMLMALVLPFSSCFAQKKEKKRNRRLAIPTIFSEWNRASIDGNASPTLTYYLEPTENHLLILAHEYQNAIRSMTDELYVRPGLYSDYAIVLAKLGYHHDAALWFNREMQRFPASRKYIETLKSSLIPDYTTETRVADTVSPDLPIPIDEAALAAELARELVPLTREEQARLRAEEREEQAKFREQARKEKEEARKEAEKDKKLAAKEKEKAKRQAAKEKEEARKQAAKEKEEARKEALKQKEEAFREMQERRKEEQKALEQERRDNIRLGKEREREAKEAKAEEERQKRGESKKDRSK